MRKLALLRDAGAWSKFSRWVSGLVALFAVVFATQSASAGPSKSKVLEVGEVLLGRPLKEGVTVDIPGAVPVGGSFSLASMQVKVPWDAKSIAFEADLRSPAKLCRARIELSAEGVHARCTMNFLSGSF